MKQRDNRSGGSPTHFWATVLVATVALGGAAAAETGAIGVELNKLEPQGADCRVYFLATNASEDAFTSLKLDLVVFDTEGIVARRLVVDLAPIRPKKTSIKAFALSGLSCDGVSRILLNDVNTCDSNSSDESECLDLIEPSSRSSVAFFE